MNKFILSLIILLVSNAGKAQNYNVINYNLNGRPVYGVKIKTNLPFVNTSQMPTVIIEGYDYGTSRPININLVWYIFDGEFINYAATSSGAYTPEMKLSNENGKVVIFINDQSYFQRFSVRVFAKGMSEVAEWFTGWSTADEVLAGTNTVTVPYYGPLTAYNGNVGIGTSDPKASLHVGARLSTEPPTSEVTIDRIAIQPYYHTGGPWFINVRDNNSTAYLDIKYGDQRLYTISHLGNVGIGTTTPSDKLSVNGNIRSRKVIVTQTGWPDYVFDSSYQLPSLDSVSSFIQMNKHLPEMPSAAIVEKEGHDLGEVQKLLLKKVEELTLYVIEMKKENKDLKQQNLQLITDVDALKKILQRK